MTFQYGTRLRNEKLNSINRTLGQNSALRIFTGAEPPDCQNVDPPGTLITIALPTTPFQDAISGAITLNGLWAGKAAESGDAVSWRIYDSEGVCQLQGNCTDDLVLNNNNVKAGQLVNVVGFNIKAGNA